MMKLILLSSVLISLFYPFVHSDKAVNVKSEALNDSLNYVCLPDSMIAIRVADAILSPIYGYNYIRRLDGYKVELVNNEYWHLTGNRIYRHKHEMGGVPHILLRRKDSKVIRIYHTEFPRN